MFRRFGWGIDLTVNGGTPGYSYAWTNDLGTYGSIVEDPSSLIAGTYNVVVTDAKRLSVE
jgi:large repetitive protein